MFFGIVENRFVESEIETPAVIPFRLAQHVGFRDHSSHVIIQVRLKGALEHLHTDGDIRIFLMQPFDYIELCQVMRVTVMLFTNKNHPARFQRWHDAIQVLRTPQIKRHSCPRFIGGA